MELEKAKKASDLYYKIQRKKSELVSLDRQIEQVVSGDRNITLTFGFQYEKKNGDVVEESIYTNRKLQLHQDALLSFLNIEKQDSNAELQAMLSDMEAM
jgi:hypothetical protein